LRAAYFATLLGLLVLVQVGAQLAQIAFGYRPFRHPPTRVPYSWDMFAIRLDRCVVGWDPPLDVEGERVARWHDREAPIEFDTVFNEANWYKANAANGCSYRTRARTVASMMCFSSDGGVDELSFPCP
jgi:hypothetical protein